MDNPKVSIILPCYNVEQYIHNIYENIVQSSYDNYEMIFVNDGSLDNTVQEIQKIQKMNDSRVVLIDKENGGVSSARNEGIKSATGKYVLFIDPDDEISLNLMTEVVNNAEATSSEFVIYGYRREDIDCPESSEDVLPRQNYEYNNTIDIVNGFIPSIIGISKESLVNWQNGGDLYWNKEWGAVWRALYRRDIIIKNSILFDRELFLNEDSIFTCHYLCYAKKMTTVNKCLYTYRVKSSGAMYSSINSDRLLTSKIALANARREVAECVYSVINRDISEWYMGSLVLSVFELYVGTGKSDRWRTEYLNCCKYTKREDVKSAISKMPLGKKIKFAVPFFFIKYKCGIVLYYLIRVFDKLGVCLSKKI